MDSNVQYTHAALHIFSSFNFFPALLSNYVVVELAKIGKLKQQTQKIHADKT